MSSFAPASSCLKSVEPTYVPTDLIMPGNLRTSTLPSTRRELVNNRTTFNWGNEPDKKRHVLRYNQAMPKSGATHEPSHKHFGTKVVRMNAAYQPYEVTQLKLSECRLNDQRLPPVRCELIPKRKIRRLEGLDTIKPYFSHTSKFDVFPSTAFGKPDSLLSEKLSSLHPKGRLPNGERTREKAMMKPTSISMKTMQALAGINKHMYRMTTYTSSYQDPCSVEKSNWKRKSSKKTESKHVSFNDSVQCYENEDLNILKDKPNKNNNSQPVELKDKDTKQESRIHEVDSLTDEQICRFCGRSKRKLVQLKYLDANGKILKHPENQCNQKYESRRWSVDADAESQGWATWPVGHTSLEEDSPNHPKIIIQGYNNKPKCPMRFFDVCECDRFPQLRESILRSEEISKRRAATFARRNYTTISVFHLLKHDQHAAKAQTAPHWRTPEKASRDPRDEEQSRSQKSNSHERYHEMYPEGIPDLRDSKRTVRRVIFSGYPSHVFK